MSVEKERGRDGEKEEKNVLQQRTSILKKKNSLIGKNRRLSEIKSHVLAREAFLIVKANPIAMKRK